VDFPNLVGFTGVVKDTLGASSFTRIDVGHDTDVTVLLQRDRARSAFFFGSTNDDVLSRGFRLRGTGAKLLINNIITF